ncbi:class I SAM-dependent methyltransferase [Burkholderia ubonensis]|uniref:class I SAM-dependent methyltransferase n=1 Tax=Burkholderia ubonensis TaxID=101571 RepID=UPI000756B2F6|nr:hypothetical protein [Burkholderia ubonensis]KVL13220.1 hypothetical protein WJ45_33390 [Burkholderia ubonensis]KVQ49525.1 hypothetical protein WK04_06970 [Burkholderia ubonensis]
MTHVIPGTRDDLSECIDLEADHPFFGSTAEADRFVDDAVLPNVAWGRDPLRVADFGGGQGLLADRCARALRARGAVVRAGVVDANPTFAAFARARGLDVAESDIGCYEGEPVDIALMRLVLHYNPASAQRTILTNVCRHVSDDGLLVLQFETGDTAACELRNRIAALCAEWTGGGARFWANHLMMSDWLRDAGFGEVREVAETSCESDVVALVRNAWRRQRSALSEAGVSEHAFYRACTEIIFAFRRAGDSTALYDKEGRLTLKTSYPIVCATKAPPQSARVSSAASGGACA